MSEHHPLIQRAIEFSENPDDAEAVASIRRGFACADQLTRRLVLDNMKTSLDTPVSLRAKAELWNEWRRLRQTHEALNRARR